MNFEDMINTIQLGDCYELIKNIPDKSIDLVYIDIPYLFEQGGKEEKTNRIEYNKDKREYYHKNEDYREYKKKYAKKYRKLEPVKSLARKDRKAVKKK